jgi:hypothetical protein
MGRRHREPNTLCSRLRDKRSLPRRDDCVAATLNGGESYDGARIRTNCVGHDARTSVYLTGLAAAQRIQLACDATDDGFVGARLVHGSEVR